MPITVGAAVTIAILAVCGVTAFYFAAKSYLWMRRDRYPRAGDDDQAGDTPAWPRRQDENHRQPKDPRLPR
jgi:uncharacterized iron-regulated membrane protein